MPGGVPVRRAFAILLIAAGPARAEPLPPTPEAGGIDPDLAQAITDAKSALAAGHATDAARTILRMEIADDRYTTAQRAALIGPARELLRQAARAHEAAGRIDLAAQDLDAAWELDARGHDPELARVLTAWAHRLDRGEALYVARRAELADPGNAEARAIDQRLSHNRFKWLGYSLEILGAAAMATGLTLLYLGKRDADTLTGSPHFTAEADSLIAERSSYLGAGWGLLAGGALALVGGIAALAVGAPHDSPVSPLLLPALPEGPR
jgi:hypothetical protein